MSSERKYTALDDELFAYVLAHGTRPDADLERVAAATEALGSDAVMQTGPDQAALLTLLARAVGATRAIEVGTFTGYGAIAIARGLAEGGRLVSCERDAERAEMAQRFITEAGLSDRVEVRVGPALDSLKALEPPFDFAYVDADKQGYDGYYEQCLRLLRPGGLIALDNTLFSGRVLNPGDNASAAALSRLNDKIAADGRVDVAMLSIGDGLTLALKL